jgi:hypothetical protein
MRRQVHGIMIMRGGPKTAWLIFLGLLASGCLPVPHSELASQIVLAPQQGGFFDLEQSVTSFMKP